jgi:hypothetical protein
MPPVRDVGNVVANRIELQSSGHLALRGTCMIRIIVDEAVKSQLLRAGEPCELVDAAGNKLGFFTREYVGYECPLSDTELDQIEREGGGRPLTDILADLEGRA